MNSYLKNYIQEYDTYDKFLVYDFYLGYGGIGDCIKFFMYLLEYCIKNKVKLYYLLSNNPIEKHLLLKFPKMYITEEKIKSNKKEIKNYYELEKIESNIFHIISPFKLYYHAKNNYFENMLLHIPFSSVFDFSSFVKENVIIKDINFEYVSFHLRLGDKYLETDKQYVICKEDERIFSEEKFIKELQKELKSQEQVIFFCDNQEYKNKLKSKFPNVNILQSNIGHTSLKNTTQEQIIDTCSEFYLLSKSKKIYGISESGFSLIASNFNNIPFIKLYN